MIGGRRVFLKVYQSGQTVINRFLFERSTSYKLPLTFHLYVTLDLMEDREIQLNKQVISDGGRGATHTLLSVTHTLCILYAIFGNTVPPCHAESRSAVAAIWV